ncbi:MAG: ATP-binding protein [Angustibacter sp.]
MPPAITTPADELTTPRTDVVELAVPALAQYVAVVRAATAGLAARLDLTLDRIEDLRIAVDEACTLLVRAPDAERAAVTEPADQITCVFRLDDTALTVDVSGPRAELPERTGYAWAVLSALVDSLESGYEDDADGRPRTWLRLVVRAGAGQWA